MLLLGANLDMMVNILALARISILFPRSYKLAFLISFNNSFNT